MINTLYIEKEILEHPKVRSIQERFPNAHHVICERYGEIFNPKSQNFRLQKQNPAFILAKKHQNFVLPTPEKYGIGNKRNFYFSHMLNCIYDCRYCFLQGMYRSAHYVLFVNFEDFAQEIVKVSDENEDAATFFSGYDGDSLALDQVTLFTNFFCPLFAKLPKHTLELRTKSINIQPLLKRDPQHNVIVAYSLNNDFVSNSLEHKTPSLNQRLSALKKLQQAGWPIGIRFDPLIYHHGWQEAYQSLFDQVFTILDPHKIHSVTLGAFRLPHPVYKNIVKLYPEEPLFFSKTHRFPEGVSYHPDQEKEMRSFCERHILEYISEEKYYSAAF